MGQKHIFSIVLAFGMTNSVVALGQDYNNEILAAIQQMPTGGGYATSPSTEANFRRALRGGNTSVATPSYCSTATYLVFVKALEGLQKEGKINLSPTALEKLKSGTGTDGKGIWGRWNANGPGTAALFAELGIGTNFTDKTAAKSGDFLKIEWKKQNGSSHNQVGVVESGHSVVFTRFMDKGTDKEKICFWSSNQEGDNIRPYQTGYGEKCTPSARVDSLVFSRLSAPANINKNIEKLPATNTWLASLKTTSDTLENALSGVGALKTPSDKPSLPNIALLSAKAPDPTKTAKPSPTPSRSLAPSQIAASTGLPESAPQPYLAPPLSPIEKLADEPDAEGKSKVAAKDLYPKAEGAEGESDEINGGYTDQSRSFAQAPSQAPSLKTNGMSAVLPQVNLPPAEPAITPTAPIAATDDHSSVDDPPLQPDTAKARREYQRKNFFKEWDPSISFDGEEYDKLKGLKGIEQIVAASQCRRQTVPGRGRMPFGYVLTVADSFKNSLCRKANAADLNHDPKSIMTGKFPFSNDSLKRYGFPQGSDATKNLAATYALTLGLGMRESSGNTAEGADKSAALGRNGSEIEAGLFQVSSNSLGLNKALGSLFNEYLPKAGKAECLAGVISQSRPDEIGLPLKGPDAINDLDWKIRNQDRIEKSIMGADNPTAQKFRKLMKICPAFAAEYTATLIRVTYKHHGPLIRKEAPINSACLSMFNAIAAKVDPQGDGSCPQLAGPADEPPSIVPGTGHQQPNT
jgi:hypothetical protein